MVAELFAEKHPHSNSRLLDPGCGPGAFIEGVIRWCHRYGAAIPFIDGVEIDPELLAEARKRFEANDEVRLMELDYLEADLDGYDFVIANPPYVSIEKLSEEEKARYRSAYASARGRFDLYFLFLERSVRQLNPGGRLVYITPEKFLYVESARALSRC